MCVSEWIFLFVFVTPTTDTKSRETAHKLLLSLENVSFFIFSTTLRFRCHKLHDGGGCFFPFSLYTFIIESPWFAMDHLHLNHLLVKCYPIEMKTIHTLVQHAHAHTHIHSQMRWKEMYFKFKWILLEYGKRYSRMSQQHLVEYRLGCIEEDEKNVSVCV